MTAKMMEASMKTMSWSRYHALSWSFARIRSSLHGRRAKRARRIAKAATKAATKAAVIAAATAPAASAVRPGAADPGRQGGGAFGFLARVSRPLSRIFRTKALPDETDI
jgi:hypothetical protein